MGQCSIYGAKLARADSPSFWFPQSQDLNPQSLLPLLSLNFLFLLTPSSHQLPSTSFFAPSHNIYKVFYWFSSFYRRINFFCLTIAHCLHSSLTLPFAISSSLLLHWTVLDEVTIICSLLVIGRSFLEMFSSLGVTLPLLCLNCS